jgi:hypothetical protein
MLEEQLLQAAFADVDGGSGLPQGQRARVAATRRAAWWALCWWIEAPW